MSTPPRKTVTTLHKNVNLPSPETFDDEYNDEQMEEELAEKNAKRSFANRLGTGMGVVSLSSNASVIAFMFVVSQVVAPVSLVACSVAIFVALIVIKRQLIDMAPTHTLRYVHNKLRRKVHHLYLANNTLKEHVDDIERQINNLRYCEGQLEKLTRDQALNVDELVNLVKENETILDDMTNAIRANATMTLVDICLDSDRDESSLFTENEIDMLLVKLDLVEGIQVNEDVLRANLEKDNSLQAVLAMLNHASNYTKQAVHHKKGGGKQQQHEGEALPVFTFDVLT